MWSQVSGLPLAGWVTLGKIQAVSDPQLANLCRRERMTSDSQDPNETSMRFQ